MSNDDFYGFPPDFFDFLADLEKHNNRDWFNEHKPRYKVSIVAPMRQFIEAMAPRLGLVSEHFIADSRPHGGSMFRIYRDTRFSKDKRPYKEHVGCQFRHRLGRDAHAPGFYVHLEANQVLFGGGIWKPDGKTLAKIRTAMVDNPVSWQRVVNDKAFIRRFGALRGERLKRSPRGFSADHPLLEDLKLKSFFVMQQAEPDLACSKRFTASVEKCFLTAGPLLSFLAFALDLPYDRPLADTD